MNAALALITTLEDACMHACMFCMLSCICFASQHACHAHSCLMFGKVEKKTAGSKLRPQDSTILRMATNRALSEAGPSMHNTIAWTLQAARWCRRAHACCCCTKSAGPPWSPLTHSSDSAPSSGRTVRRGHWLTSSPSHSSWNRGLRGLAERSESRPAKSGGGGGESAFLCSAGGGVPRDSTRAAMLL